MKNIKKLVVVVLLVVTMLAVALFSTACNLQDVLEQWGKGDGTSQGGGDGTGGGETPDTPSNPDDGVGDETPSNPDDGVGDETPSNPDDGTGDETPSNPSDTPTTPDDSTDDDEPSEPVVPENPQTEEEYKLALHALIKKAILEDDTFEESFLMESIGDLTINYADETVSFIGNSSSGRVRFYIVDTSNLRVFKWIDSYQKIFEKLKTFYDEHAATGDCWPGSLEIIDSCLLNNGVSESVYNNLFEGVLQMDNFKAKVEELGADISLLDDAKLLNISEFTLREAKFRFIVGDKVVNIIVNAKGVDKNAEPDVKIQYILDNADIITFRGVANDYQSFEDKYGN